MSPRWPVDPTPPQRLVGIVIGAVGPLYARLHHVPFPLKASTR